MALHAGWILIFLLIFATTRSCKSQIQSKELYQSTINDQMIKNFQKTLDTLLKNENFQPLVISIGHHGKRGKFHEIAMKYFRQIPLDNYQFDLSNFSNKTCELPFGTTWLIIIDDYDILQTKIFNITQLWKTTDRYVIFCLDRLNEKNDDLTSLFHNLWNKHSVSKIIVTLIDENFRYIYVYRPFEKTNENFGAIRSFDLEKNDCYDDEMSLNSTSLRKIEETTRCYSNENKSELNTEEGVIFENFHNMNDYPIDVTIFPSLMMDISLDKKKNRTIYGKLDAHVMRLVEKHLSAKFIINSLVMNNLDPFKVALERFENDEKAQLIFTGYFTKFYIGKYKFTSSIFQDKLCLVAPSSKPVPKFFMPLLPFTNELWFLLVIYNFIVALIWLFIKSFESRIYDKIDRNNVEITLESLAITRSRIKADGKGFLGYTDYRRSVKGAMTKTTNLTGERRERVKIFNEPPKMNKFIVRFFDLTILALSPLQGGKTNGERAFLVGTLFFGIVVIGLYESYLVSSLSKPIYYPELKTLSDVADSNRTIVTKYENLMSDIPNDGSPEIEKLRSKFQFLSKDKITYDMVAYRGMISLGRFSSFELENLTDYVETENNRLLLHMVEECPATYFLSYVARLTSPYLERINCLLLRIQQAGLIEKWYSDMLRTGKIAASQTKTRRREKRVKLTLAHLTLTFIGLGVGLFCSTVVFFGEIYYASKLRSTTTRLTIHRTQPSQRVAKK